GAPFEEIDNMLPLGGFLIDVKHRPAGAADRIGILARRVRDGIAKIVWNVLQGIVGGRADRLEIGLDGVAFLVFYEPILDVVFHGINELDVADAARGGLDAAGDAFVALSAFARGPVDRGGHAHLGLPLRANLGKVIDPDIGGAAAIGA